MSALDDLASTVVQLLATAATAAATGAGGAAATLVGDLVRNRLTGAGQGGAVAAFEAAPQEPAAQAALHSALVTVMGDDETFAVHLRNITPAPAAPTHSASGGGVTVQGTGNKVRGNFAGRDQIVNNIRNGDARTLAALAVALLVLALAVYGGVRAVGGGDSPPRGEGSANEGSRGGGSGDKGSATLTPATPTAPAAPTPPGSGSASAPRIDEAWLTAAQLTPSEYPPGVDDHGTTVSWDDASLQPGDPCNTRSRLMNRHAEAPMLGLVWQRMWDHGGASNEVYQWIGLRAYRDAAEAQAFFGEVAATDCEGKPAPARLGDEALYYVKNDEDHYVVRVGPVIAVFNAFDSGTSGSSGSNVSGVVSRALIDAQVAKLRRLLAKS